MSCPDWRPLLDESAAALERARARRHVEGCEECRRAALAADPIAVFTVFPPTAAIADGQTSQVMIERMRERVAGARALRLADAQMRRRRRLRLGSRAAAAIFLPLAALGLVVAADRRAESPTPPRPAVAGEREPASRLDPLLAEALARLPLIEGAAPVTVQEEGIGYDLVMVVDAGLEL